MDAHTWNEALAGWRAEQRAAGQRETTIRLWASWLRRFARTHPDPWGVTRQDLIAWLAETDWMPETRRSARSALKSFYGWSLARGLVEESPTESLPVIRVPRAAPRPAPDMVICEAILGAQPRVRLMIRIGMHGLRRAEIAAVHTADLAARDLWVVGKGGVGRIVPVSASVDAELRSLPAGWAFPGAAGHLSAGYVGKLISAALPGRWTAHSLRHTAATMLLDAGLDLHEVAEILGHASVRTTQRYSKVRRKRLAAGIDAVARRIEGIAA